MWNFSTISDEHFKEFLWNGKLDENLNDILVQFFELSPSKQFEFIYYIKKKEKPINLEYVQRIFELDYQDAKALILNPFRIAKIPIVGESNGKISRTILIKGLKKIITNLENLRHSLKVIKDFLGKGFCAVFEDRFSGESFMLPVAISLYVERLPDNLIFTGKIDKKGNIYDVDEIERKAKIAQENGLKLIPPIYLDNIREIKEWLDAETYEIPFYVTKTTQNYEGEFKNFVKSVKINEFDKKLKLLKLFNDLEEKDLILITGRIEPKEEEWKRYATEFFKKIKRIEDKLEAREIMHFAINGSAAFSLACGMLFGSQKPFYFYHYQNGVYHPLEVKNVRYLKERLKNYNHVDYTYEYNSEKLAIIISMAFHEAEADAKVFAERENMSYLIVRHKKSGNIPIEHMVEVARETASLIQDIRRDKSFNEFHFFLSCPVSIAFMLGVSFGYYNPGFIYNYEKPHYVKVLSIEELRKIRECLKEGESYGKT